jgi:hypothetical protein
VGRLGHPSEVVERARLHIVSAVRIVDLGILIFLLVLAVRLVPTAIDVARIYGGIGRRRLEDATSFAPPPPPPVSVVIDELAPLGLERIGVRSVVLPNDQRRFEWNLVDAASTTYVALVPTRAMSGGVFIVCYSAFPDGAFLSTSYPQGKTVRRPDLDTVRAGRTPVECVRAHYDRLASFRLMHGAPLPNRSMADLLVRDDTYRRRHGGATMRTRVYGFVAVTAAVVLAASFELLRVVALDR